HAPAHRKDDIMKLLWILSAVLAIALAEEAVSDEKPIEDTKAEESEIVENVLRTGVDTINPSASTYQAYVPPSQRPPRPWNNYQNYVPAPPNGNYASYFTNPTQTIQNPEYNIQNNFPAPSFNPPQNNFISQQSTFNPAENIPSIPQNLPSIPQNIPSVPQNLPPIPQNNYIPANNVQAVQSDYVPPQNDWNQQQAQQGSWNQQQGSWNQQQGSGNQQQGSWNQQQQGGWTQAPAPSTTPATVIKNEQKVNDDGSYKYEYKISDGQWVSEEGYTKNKDTDNEIVVKKGWYSYTGADGKVYTVTYFADETGYHASGAHLPTPPPVPEAIQAALDQAAKEEAEKNKQQQQQNYYPSSTQAPYYPTTQAAYYPQQQQNYYPQQQTYYPQQNQQNYYQG
ncbi:hypothetical protein JYU34_015861, partial [Plutella xylostella]